MPRIPMYREHILNNNVFATFAPVPNGRAYLYERSTSYVQNAVTIKSRIVGCTSSNIQTARLF